MKYKNGQSHNGDGCHQFVMEYHFILDRNSRTFYITPPGKKCS